MVNSSRGEGGSWYHMPNQCRYLVLDEPISTGCREVEIQGAGGRNKGIGAHAVTGSMSREQRIHPNGGLEDDFDQATDVFSTPGPVKILF